jgi:TatD DNase family protein
MTEAFGNAGCQVKCILNTYPEDFYAKKGLYPDNWFSCGIHPWNAAEADIEQLEKILSDPGVVAVGEVGLDKLKGSDLNVQIKVFRQQIELATDKGKPLIIHCVKAWEELIALYKEYRKYSVPWIIHGYRGNPDQTRQLAKIGFKFSIGEKYNADSLKHIPINDIFCETDMSDIAICKIYENISTEIGINKNHFAILVAENVDKAFK